MRNQISIFWDQVRLRYYWRKIRNRIEHTGALHETLLITSPEYKEASRRYRQARKRLIEKGEYIPASKRILEYS